MASKKPAAPSLSSRLVAPNVARAAQSVDLFPDGSAALVGGFPGLWSVDLLTGKERVRYRKDTGHVLWNARVDREGTRVVGAFGDCTIHAWEATTGKLLWSKPTHGAIVTRISLSYDGARALTVSGNNQVRVWDVTDGRELGAHVLKKSLAIAGAAAPSGRYGAYGGTDGFLRCHDFERGADAWTAEGKGWIEDIDASADGRFFVSGGRGKAVLVWDAATGRRIRTLEVGANVTRVGVSADGRFASACAGKKPPPVWDLESGGQLATLGEHEGNVRSLRFGHGGRTLATLDDAGSVRVFDLPGA